MYVIYRLIILKMGTWTKRIFHLVLYRAAIITVILFFAEATVSVVTIHQVNKQLGFRYSTPETEQGELFIITRVVPEKTMDQSGLRKDDQLLMSSTSDLYRLLINNQGKVVSFPVIRDNTQILIRINVPKMEVPLKSVSFLIL
jgi:hypothetical protein